MPLISQHLHEAIESLPPAASPDGESLASQTFSDLLANPVKLQHRLSTDIAEMKAAECLVQASSDQDAARLRAARLRSSQGRGAGAWLQAIPSTENYSLKSPEFKIASYLRMGLPLPSSDCVRNCDCGVKLDSLGYHLLTCKFGGGPVWQHNSLVSTWSKCLNELQIPNQIEPRNRYTNSENRPDIVAFDPVDYSSADLDVSMAHPLSGDSMKGAAAESGYAAKKREMKKEQKYNQQVSQSGSRLSFVLLVFEHYGYWGPSAEDYLDCISKKAKDTNGHNCETDFRDRWRKQISVNIQKCNAKVISKKVSKLSMRRAEDFLYDTDIQHHVH